MATDLDPTRRKDILSLHPATARLIHRALYRFSETGHADIRRLVNVTTET